MQDKKPFEPHQPETMKTMEISLREAKILIYMRKTSFGKFVIHKANSLIVRIEPQTSVLIDENGELEV